MRKYIYGFAKKVVVAGVMAGTLSTFAQLVLWLVFTHDLPDILYRDTRMAAAILLGQGVLLRNEPVSLWIWFVAGGLHFVLSILYAAVIVLVAARSHGLSSWLAGTLLGALLYAINMYGFTFFFPWFMGSREPITFAAHLVFGLVAVIDWQRIGRHAAEAA